MLRRGDIGWFPGKDTLGIIILTRVSSQDSREHGFGGTALRIKRLIWGRDERLKGDLGG